MTYKGKYNINNVVHGMAVPNHSNTKREYQPMSIYECKVCS